MENKTMKIIGAIAILLLIIYYFYNRNANAKREGTSSDSGTNGGTNGASGTSSSSSSSSNSSSTSSNTTSTSTSANTSTSSNTSSGNIVGSQITINNPIPVYYLQLPKQPGYPHTVSNNIPPNDEVAGVKLPLPNSSNIITITKVWNFGSTSNPKIYYETNQKVLYISNPASNGIGDFYLIKK